MRRKGLLCMALGMILSLPLGVTARAAEEEMVNVRVGYFSFAGYHQKAEDGTLSGYGYDLLQKIGIYTNWKYEYLGYDSSYADTLDMLERGEVDLVTSVSKTPEREKKFLFSEKPVGTNATIFTVKAGNTKVVAGDYSTYDGLTIGMLRGNSKNQTFQSFAKSHGFQYNPVYYDLEGELTQALQDGKLDGIVTGSLRDTYNEWEIESFATANFYAVTRKDNGELMQQINRAIEKLDEQEPDWRTFLKNKYYAMDVKGKILLNGEERALLAQYRKSGTGLKVLANPCRKPYSFYEDGKIKGVSPAIFRLVAKKLSLKYQFIPVKDREEYNKVRQSGEADIVLDFVEDYYQADKAGYKLTNSYIDINYVGLALKHSRKHIKTVAVLENSGILDKYVSDYYHTEDILRFRTAEECVEAVLDKKAQTAILNIYTAEWLIQQDEKNRLDFVMLDDLSLSYSMGIKVKRGYKLISVLDKGISSLSKSEVYTAIQQQTDKEKLGVRDTLLSFFYDNPHYGFAAVVFIFLFFLVCVVLGLRMRNQHLLERKVAEVSRRYEEQKQELSDTLALAEQANRAKTTFLNNMSHDIRTPMNAVIGFTNLALKHLDSRERTKDYLEKISQSSSHLLSLLNDVLDMSRIESGNVTIEELPENLPEILHGMRNIIQADVRAKRLEFFAETMDVSHENIFCDKLRLNQILLNLLSNAIKFTEPGGKIFLCVSEKPSSREGYGTYEFQVKDTGIGMSEEFQKTIFDLFTRERNSTVSRIQGTGLGMAITRNIVDMMGGTIDVSSEPGKGTEFVVQLDFRYDGHRERMMPVEELKDMRALVVDDDIVTCQSVSKMLRQAGLRPQWCMYGKEAVIRTREAMDDGDPYQVYVIDWSMSDMNGIETARRIRRIVGESASIILLSAYDWSDIEEEAREAGVAEFVSKPLFASELNRVLEGVVGKDSVEEEKKEQAIKVFQGKHILLVEDNELNREIAVEILSEMGFVLQCAENGQQACDMLRQEEPGYYDLVLMDVQMPVMDGYTATRRIREMEEPGYSSVPIIAMTANAFEEDRKKSEEVGMDGHLAKPLDLEEMAELLGDIFSR